MKSQKAIINDIKNIRINRISSVILITAMLLTIGTVFVSAYDPADDPIVTVSYLNEVYLKQIESQILDNIDFKTYEELKVALSTTAVDEAALVNRAKNAVLDSFGYTSWARAKTAFTTTTITEADRQKIADEAIAQLMRDLNISSTAELKAKLETVEEISQQTKLSLVNELGFESVEELKQFLESGGSYRTVVLSRGDKIKAIGDCEIILMSGLTVLAEGTAVDLSEGKLINKGDLLSALRNSTVFSGNTLLTVSSECVLMIRGAYIKQ